jgi:hypothetical protein
LVEFDRARQLVGRADVPPEVYDQRQAELTSVGAERTQALADVYQVRVSLGLPAQPEGGVNLDHVPSDLDETFSAVLQAQAENCWVQANALASACAARLVAFDCQVKCPAKSATNGSFVCVMKEP